MTNPTIPPQQPKPERVCCHCQFYLPDSWRNGTCDIGNHLPPFLQVDEAMDRRVHESDICVLFRASEES